MSDKDLVSRRRVLARKKTMYGWSSGEEEVVSVEYIESIPPVKQPMSAVEFVMARNRMCDVMATCADCPYKIYCIGAKVDAEDEVAIVEEWAKEHPEGGD